MAFQKKTTAVENLAQRIQEAQEIQNRMDEATQSDTAVEAANKLRELQAAFRKPETQKYLSDDVNKVMTDLIELYDSMSAALKDMFGIDTQAVKFIAVHTAVERAINEKKNEELQTLKDINDNIVAKKKEVERELQEIRDKILSAQAEQEARLAAAKTRVDVELESYRKDQIAQINLTYKAEIQQIKKSLDEAEQLQAKVSEALEKAANAEKVGYEKGQKEEHDKMTVALNTAKSSYESEKRNLEFQLKIKDEKVNDLTAQLAEVKAENAKLQQQMVEMATAQFKQPVAATK